MLSATASVRMIVGALAETGVKGKPIHPPKPMAVAMESPMTITVLKVPAKERRRRPMTMINTPYMMGTSVAISSWLTSIKALFNMAIPLI